LNLFTNLVSLAFADGSIYGKWMRIVLAPTYDKYFDQKIFAIGSEGYLGYEAIICICYPYMYCIKLLQHLLDGTTSYPDTGHTIRVLAVTSSPTGLF